MRTEAIVRLAFLGWDALSGGFVRRWRRGAALLRDAEAGAAIELSVGAVDGEVARVVVLAESRLSWSADGLPAEWRGMSS